MCTSIIINSANQIKMMGILLLLALTIIGGTGARSEDFSPAHLVKGQFI